MIIVRLVGGLGNQMFQYAAALRLAMRHRTVLKLDLTFLQDNSPSVDSVFREFDLPIFKLPETSASVREVRKFQRLKDPDSRSFPEKISDKLVSRRIFVATSQGFQPEVLELPNETYLEGYFQDERYFLDIRDEIRARFRIRPQEDGLSPATRDFADKIRSNQSTCVHIRRGDYVSNPSTFAFHGVCEPMYYQKGLEELSSRGEDGPVFVFSDDVPWCTEHFNHSDNVTVVGEEHAGPRASIHLWLMTLCRNFIIANSSFSWWAAWLAEDADKVVICPSPWFRSPAYANVDVCPPSWVRISS